MNYSLDDIWEQSRNNSKSVCLSSKDEEAYVYKGIKITRSEGLIRLYNTTKNQFKYTEIDKHQYTLFRELGFLNGVKEVLKVLYKEKINELNYKIKDEVNTRNNKKHYDSLKLKREFLINKYSKLN